MFIFLEKEVKQRIYELQKESDTQRLLQKKKESFSAPDQSLSTIKTIRNSPKPLISHK